MQDDGHIFCLPEQTAGEIRGVLDLVEEVMGAFGFKEYEVPLPLFTVFFNPKPQTLKFIVFPANQHFKE